LVGKLVAKELHFGNPFEELLCYPVYIAVPLSLGVSVLKRSVFSLPSLRLCGSIRIAFGFAFSADNSPVPAATTPKLHSGDITGATRCTCAISAASAGPATMQKCRFSGFIADCAIKVNQLLRFNPLLHAFH
jgi:hypothetical protein